MKRLGQFSAYVAVRILMCVVQALPVWAGHGGARWLAVVFYDVLRLRRRITDENLRRAFSHLSGLQRRRLARAMWEHLLLFVVEVAHTGRKIHDTNWWKYIRVGQAGELTERMLSGRSLLMATAHFGNFELATYFVSMFGHHVYSVARPLDNPYLDHFLNNFRGSRGQTILSKQSDYERMLELLKQGAVISFVADQYAGSKGCWVDFFGRPASAHKVVALFSLDYDAPLAVGYCRRLGRPLHYEIAIESFRDPRTAGEDAASIKQLTQWYTSELEKIIRRDPDQYWWLHDRWKDNRKKRKERRQRRKAQEEKAA